MLRKIRLYGRLAKFIGRRVLEADVGTAAEAVRFLVTNWPELEKHMADQHYRVSVGTYDLSTDELHHPAGQQDISIVPVIGGAGSSTWQIIAGVALIALSFIPGIGALAVSLMVGVGASLVLGGVAQLLMPVPGSETSEQQDPQESYSFSGIQQTSREGVPVPIVYGEVLVGSVVVSAGINTKAI